MVEFFKCYITAISERLILRETLISVDITITGEHYRVALFEGFSAYVDTAPIHHYRIVSQTTVHYFIPTYKNTSFRD